MPLNHSSIEAARTAKEAFKAAFGATEGLVGVGLTRKDSGYAVKVNMQCRTSAKLPKVVEGVPVVVEVVGVVRPLTPASTGLAVRASKTPRAKR